MASALTTIHSFSELLAHCRAFGAARALTDAATGRTVSFAELCENAEELALRLPEMLQPGDRVVLYGLHPLDFVPAFFAIALRGAIAVPLDTRASAEFVTAAVALTAPALQLYGDDAAAGEGSSVLRMSKLRVRPKSGQRATATPDADAPVEIIFTSGTWSRPKGVTLSERNILANAAQVLALYPHAREDTSLAVLPLSHAYQQTVGLFVPLIAGSEIVFLTELNSEALTKALTNYRVRTMLVVPRVLTLIERAIVRRIRSKRLRALFQHLVPLLRFLPRPLRRRLFAPVHARIGAELRTLVVGGAPLPLALDHFFQGLGYEVVVGYGASEASPVISISRNERRRAGEVGMPVPGMETRLSGEGELIISGDNLFLGYWPDLMRPSSFNTEDIAVVHNGAYILRGRTKNLVIYENGDKVFCEDIEHLARTVPGIEDACVVEGAPGILHCVVRGSGGPREEQADIRAAVNARLPFGVRIQHVHFLKDEEFPYTHTLKPDRKEIRRIATNEAASLQG